VIDWDTKGHAEAYAMWLEAVLADGGEDCRQLCLLANEPLVEGMLVGKPENTLSVSQRRDVSHSPLKLQSADARKLEERKLKYQRDFLKRWVESDIDAIIMPVLPWVAFPPKTWVKSKQWVGYTAHWNLLNYASLTIPATTVDPSLDQPNDQWKEYIPRNESDAFNHQQCEHSFIRTK
jgi:amidase